MTIQYLTNDNAHNGSIGVTYTDNTSAQLASGVVYQEGISFFAQKDIKVVGMYCENANVSIRLKVVPVCDEMRNKIKDLESFFTPDNLFDPESVTDGWIGTNNGVITTDTSHVTSDYIPVESGKTYTLRQPLAGFYGATGAARIPLFDENKNFV